MLGTDYQFVVPHHRVIPRHARTVYIGQRPQRGAVAVMFAGVLLVILGFCGLALDLSQMYNRKAEMQNAADAVALAAARELDGTAAGIDRAVLQATRAAARMTYSYNGESIAWSDSAIKFGPAPGADLAAWLDASMARVTPQQLLFAKVDTSALAARHGEVTTILIRVIAPSFAVANISSRAVAGRSSLNVTPLAVCPLSPDPAVSRSGELVEYGFRRGVSYDLMHLNPGATTPENFLINPIAPPGTVGSSVIGNLDIVEPFVCTGTMAMPRVTGGAITVERSFPLDPLYLHLNSRFGTYTAPCKATSSPPDANIRSFSIGGGVPWMSTPPPLAGQTAKPTMIDGKLWTVADPSPPPPGTSGPMYGPLWAFAKAAQYTGGPEPAAGYPTFSATAVAWATLYPPVAPGTGSPAPVLGAYPPSTPYLAIAGSPNFLNPPSRGVRNRRVLRVPLLQCPVPAGAKVPANVVAIAKFFMTVPATSTQLFAEFAGVASEQSLGGEVELYP